MKVGSLHTLRLLPSTTAQEQKPKIWWRCWSVLLSSLGLSSLVPSLGGRPLSQEEAITPKETWKKARLQFANAHKEKDLNLWRHVLSSDQTEMELFGHNDHLYIWTKLGEACKPENTIPTVKYEASSIMLRGCFAAGGAGALRKIDGIMTKGYVEILKRKRRHKMVFQMDNDNIYCLPTLIHTANMVTSGFRITKTMFGVAVALIDINPIDWKGLYDQGGLKTVLQTVVRSLLKHIQSIWPK